MRNWREYEAGLRNRGSLTVWISLTAGKLVNWDAPRPKEEETGPSTQVLEPRHRDGYHPMERCLDFAPFAVARFCVPLSFAEPSLCCKSGQLWHCRDGLDFPRGLRGLQG